MTAEQVTTLATFERFGQAAAAAGVVVVPAMGFYGALADLLATAAMGDLPDAEALTVAVALDSWKPTAGTRLTGERNRARRLVVAAGVLSPLAEPPPRRDWTFPRPSAFSRSWRFRSPRSSTSLATCACARSSRS